MKILHVLERSIPDLAGYTIRAKYIVENQKRFDLDPIVVTSPFLRDGNPHIRKEIINNVTYYRTNFIKSPDKDLHKIVSYWTRFSMLQRYKKTLLEIAGIEKPDIIHAHSSYTNGIAANYVSRKTGIPSIYELRSLWGESAVIEDELKPGSLKYWMIWNLELNAIRNAKRIITISRGISDELVARGIDSNKIDVVPNGVDTKLFLPVSKDEYLVERYKLTKDFVIGYIGSIRKLEGLSCLIEAFQKVNDRIPQTKLLIVGKGPEKAALEALAERCDPNGSITFTGAVPHTEIPKYYSIIDLFVFPRIDAKISQTVTPLKPLEAMSAGKVCIASDVGGLRELIRDNYNGLLFDSGDIHALAEKIISLIEDKKLYDTLKRNGIEWVKRERDWGILIPQYLHIYQELLGRNH